MKKILISSVITTSIMFGASTIACKHHEDKQNMNDASPLERNQGGEISKAMPKMGPLTGGMQMSEAMQSSRDNTNNLKYSDMTNDLIPAKLITGIEFTKDANPNEISPNPVLINFNYKNMNCAVNAYAIENSQNTHILLSGGKCGNDNFKLEGYFFDWNKNFGTTPIVDSSSNKKIIKPQDGFIVVRSVNHIQENTAETNQKFELYDAEIKTKTLIIGDTEKNGPLPVLISFEKSNEHCSAIGQLNNNGDSSTINLGLIKCDNTKEQVVRAKFVSSNKILGPVESLDKDTEQKTVPLQNGFVFIY